MTRRKNRIQRTKNAVFVWIIHALYRRLDRKLIMPVGLPGQRDPDNVCEFYSPRNPIGQASGCISDGHYLCKGCHWLDMEARKAATGE